MLVQEKKIPWLDSKNVWQNFSDVPDSFCRNIKLLAQQYKKFCTPLQNLKKPTKNI